MSEEQSRAEFEAWVSRPPFERSVKTFGEHSGHPGEYVDIETYLAWLTWQAARKETPCSWRWDDCHQKWDTSCGTGFYFDADCETPAEAGFKFCPHCGGRIEVKKPEETEPEE